MSEVGKLWVSITTKTDDFQKGLNGAEKSIKSLQGKLDSAAQKFNKFGNVMTIGVTLPIVAAFKGILDAAMYLEATEAKFNTVFEGMTDDATAFIMEFKKLTPATVAEARGFATSIQDLLVPMKFAREDATKLTGKFVMLTGALANFNNAEFTTAEIVSKVQQALVGQYEGIRQLGIVTDKAAIQQKVLEMGLANTKDEITSQMETLALYEIMAESSTDAVKAYTEANIDSKTKMALLKVEVIDTAAAFGVSLLPMINKAIEWVGKLTKYFGSLTEEQQETILKVALFVAAIGPASKLISGLLGLTKMLLGVRTALIAVQTASTVAAGAQGLGAVTGAAKIAAGAGGLGAIKGAAMGAAGGVGVAVAIMVAKIALIAGAIYLAIEAWKRLKALEASGPIMPGYQPGQSLGGNFSHTITTGTGSNKTGKTSGNSNAKTIKTQSYDDARFSAVQYMFDTGGIVPGPRGAPQLAIVHGGETILPTHKGGSGANMDNTIRHEIDLINVPATVDKQSLEAGLTEMLNSPQVKRRLDRISYENTVNARGLGI